MREDDPTADDPTADDPTADDPTADDPTEQPGDDERWLEPEDLTDEELGVGRVADPEAVAAFRRARRDRAQRWRHLPDEPVPAEPEVTPAGVGSVLRALRWRTGRNQRELAAAAGVPLSSVIRIEAEADSDLRLSTLVRLLDTAGLRLAVVDDDGTHLAIPPTQDRFRDRGDRLLPAHRPTFDPHEDWWWGFGLLQQPYPGRPVPARVSRGRRPRRGAIPPAA